jgi:glutaredoxin
MVLALAGSSDAPRVGGLIAGCDAPADRDKPPAPPAGAATAQADEAEAPADARYKPGETAAVLTFAGERGKFSDGKNVDDVPAESRGLVKVALLDGPQPPATMVWAANLRGPEPDGSFVLKPVPRDLYEELALGQGMSSKVELPDGLEPPETVATNEGVIVYKTAWCGVCKKVEAYLERKGVRYVAKDIEKDREAAAELQAKAAKAGIQTGSVPVIDVGGELLVGFNRARLEQLL